MGNYTIQQGEYAGLVVTTKQVNPSIIQRVMNSVTLPQRPVYEVTLASGRKQVFPMDPQAAKETPGGEAQLEYYQETLTQARTEQNNKVMEALFLLGTDFELPKGDWEEIDLLLGLEIPSDLRKRKVFFLMTHLEPVDIMGLTTAVMREAGVAEDVIQEAEDSFRDSVRDGSGEPGSVAETIRHSQNHSENQVETQPPV